DDDDIVVRAGARPDPIRRIASGPALSAARLRFEPIRGIGGLGFVGRIVGGIAAGSGGGTARRGRLRQRGRRAQPADGQGRCTAEEATPVDRVRCVTPGPRRLLTGVPRPVVLLGHRRSPRGSRTSRILHSLITCALSAADYPAWHGFRAATDGMASMPDSRGQGAKRWNIDGHGCMIPVVSAANRTSGEPKVVFATDFNGDVAKGLCLATRLARDRSATLLIVHVLPLHAERGDATRFDVLSFSRGDTRRAIAALKPTDEGVPYR